MFRITFSVITICLLALTSFAQSGKKVRFSCGYGEGNHGADLCADIQKRSFASNEHAERAIDLIIKPLGLKRNFILLPCPRIENAIATIYNDGIRYIVYDNDFMAGIDNGANTDWASVSILAHEIGHHLQGHTTQLVHNPPTKEELRLSRENELEADEFSGFAMFKLGRTLSEAQAAMRSFPDVADEENSTHPKKARRLEAIKMGYEDAKSQQPSTGGGSSSKQFVIDSPSNGGVVGITSPVRGKTPYPELNHYIVVISLQAQRYFIQQPIRVLSDGTLEGFAAFGTQSYGEGDQWSIRIFATRSSFSVGEIKDFPKDAVFSNEIIVTRNR